MDGNSADTVPEKSRKTAQDCDSHMILYEGDERNGLPVRGNSTHMFSG